jgi:CheY-like chemotaxis protein
LNHKRKVIVDTIKLERVFANILENAFQAVNCRGKIWIYSEELGNESTQSTLVKIGNAGSLIPAEQQSRLFDAFFTSGKKGGTGLGLAIAKQVINAHGGKIWCESATSLEYPDGFVEFNFTLPTANIFVTHNYNDFVISSLDFKSRLERHRHNLNTGDEFQVINQEFSLENELIAILSVNEISMFPILIVDDEAVYRNSLSSLLLKSGKLAKKIEIHFAKDSDEAERLVHTVFPRLIILDIDLGGSSKNGLEISNQLRNKNFTGRICIHSNRFLASDYQDAMQAGANSVLTKPMSRSHFLKILIEAAQVKQPF